MNELLVKMIETSEIFIASILVFGLYSFILFHKKFFQKNRNVIFAFIAILFLFFQHIGFKVAEYFFEFQFIIPYKMLFSFVFTVLFYYSLFFIRKQMNQKIWWTVVSFHILAMGLVFFSWFQEILVLTFVRSLVQAVTLIFLYLMIVDFFIRKG